MYGQNRLEWPKHAEFPVLVFSVVQELCSLTSLGQQGTLGSFLLRWVAPWVSTI